MRLVFSMLCLLSLLFMAVTCNGDDAFWPAYRQELVEVLTDEIGQTAYLVRDDADTLAVSNGMAWGNITPDKRENNCAWCVLCSFFSSPRV